jgi:UDP-glucose 4-epimerase
MRENVLGTHSVLQAMKNQGVGNIAFSSSATVYGEPNVFPTPEHNELIQTSVYGASKLAGEAFIEAFCNYYDITSYIFRFVSWIGERYTHGVVFDFAKKLLLNPHMLPILGDGTQKKSYLYVADGVSGIFSAIDSFKDSVNIFNLGHSEYLEVSDVAKIIIDEMGLNDVELAYAGGNRGWKGDSPFVHLDTSKIRSTGWLPNVSIEEGLRRTVRYLLKNSDLFTRK